MTATDYHLTVKIRNGRIVKRMRELGIETFADLARRIGCPPGALSPLVTMREKPILKNGEWREVALDLSAVLNCQPDDLFNDRQKYEGLQNNSAETFLSESQCIGIAHDGFAASDAKIEVQRLLTGLSERERFSVVTINEGGTFDDAGKFTEIGEKWDVTRERSRQIYQRALRKMKSASRAKHI